MAAPRALGCSVHKEEQLIVLDNKVRYCTLCCINAGMDLPPSKDVYSRQAVKNRQKGLG